MGNKIPSDAIKFSSHEEFCRLSQSNDPEFIKIFDEFKHKRRGGFLAVTYHANKKLHFLGFVAKTDQGDEPYIRINESGDEGSYQVGELAGYFRNGHVVVHANGFEEGSGIHKKIKVESFIKHTIKEVIRAYKKYKAH